MAKGKKKVGILAECVCDLPKSTLSSCGVDILYFLVETENGVFTDTDEITAENVFSYMEAGGSKTRSSPPPPEVYRREFEKNLKRYDDVILVAISVILTMIAGLLPSLLAARKDPVVALRSE